MKSKKILAVWLAIIVFGFGVNSVSANGTVILYPGYIKGTISVTGETVTTAAVDAYSIPPAPAFDGHDGIAQNGEYLVVVEGGYQYGITSTARMVDTSHPDYNTWSYLSMGRQERLVPISPPNVTLDFSMDPGYIVPVVAVTGGNIGSMAFSANTNYDSAEEISYSASHSIEGKGSNYLEGTTSFPMKPWESIDVNKDGDYIDSALGDTYLRVSGKVWIDGIRYTLPSQYINLTLDDSTYVFWTINVESGSIFGSINVQGEAITYYYVYGSANFDGIPIGFTEFRRPGSQAYSVKVPPTTWTIYPSLYLHDSANYNNYNYLRLPSDTIEVPPNEDVEHNWDIVPGYVTGTVDLYGAYGNFKSAAVYAQCTTSSSSAIVNSQVNNYRLILNEGDWKVGRGYVHLFFDYETPYGTSNFYVSDNNIDSRTVTPGNTISGVDFSYGTATITVNFLVAGGGELKLPKLFASLSEGQISSTARSTGSGDLTTLGESTITVLAGSHIVSAYATVAGSYTKFGEFAISVEPGDIIEQDIGAPTVDVIYPGGLQHICGSSVDVEGRATDDSEVDTITVNGVGVEHSSTNNPDDPNEVSFTTTVEGLEIGENIITIVVTDTYGKSITVDRTVIRDPCNLPPEIISISGPSEPVALGTDFEMTGTFTDPDIDDTHSAIWDWGDGTTSVGTVDPTGRTVTDSHVYETSGVYTITLTVTDSFGESDTITWSQYCVIYDPSAGFVTGGGWIDSPAGAFPEDPSLSGKANFGFVSKYKKGTTVPTGNTEFQFKAGDLNFHSDTYEWLVIAGPKAMFKGTGTINGDGSYKFMVMAVDGDLSGGLDKFRIKIWREDEVTGEEFIIYDNGLEGTEIGGGSIKIHNGGNP
ncbi:MAG: PKD domain-containing protein [Candidatus Thorarchaeota archaeon]|jgi:hypothetical protein